MGTPWALPAAVIAAIGTGLLMSSSSGSVQPASIVQINGRDVLVRRGSSSRILLYFHGHDTKITTIAKNVIPVWEKSYAGTIVVPQLGPKSQPGDLGLKGGYPTLLGKLGFNASNPVDVVAHSGGGSAAAALLDRGEVRVSNVGLLDALYGGFVSFSDFAKADASRHFANVFGPSTKDNSLALARVLTDELGDRAVLSLAEADLPISAWRDLLSHKASSIGPAELLAHPEMHGAVPVKYGGLVLEAFVR